MKEQAKHLLQDLTKDTAKPVDVKDRELDTALGQIWDIAKEFKLDPFPTQFDVVPSHIMYQIGSYGLPHRFSHWSRGRDYWQMKNGYDHGISKIYEVVINSDPSQGYLLENNANLENKVVMAHVLGHTDFFKNNYLFKQTRRNMPEMASLHASRIQDYEYHKGKEVVEKVLDAALALEEHVDPYRQTRPSRDEEVQVWKQEWKKRKRSVEKKGEFDDLFVAASSAKIRDTVKVVFPPDPDKDLLGIIRNHAPYLEDWERDAVDIVRAEALYFYPQRRTKIMNEGWASYWHLKIMHEMGARDLITPAEDEHFTQMHVGVVQPNPQQLNPYFFGLKMFEYIEDYHNGKLTDKENKWLRDQGHPVYPEYTGDFKDSPGLAKIREVMEDNDDQSFIRNYFDKNAADRMNMFIYEEQEFSSGSITVVKEKGWMIIRDTLVGSMNNNGSPYIECVDIDYKQQQELYLKHTYEGRELDQDYVKKTLPYVYHLWRRPVHLESNAAGKPIKYVCDGREGKDVKRFVL